METIKPILVVNESTYQLVHRGIEVYEELKLEASTYQQVNAKDYLIESSESTDRGSSKIMSERLQWTKVLMNASVNIKQIFKIIGHDELQKIANEVDKSILIETPDHWPRSEGQNYNYFIGLAVSVMRAEGQTWCFQSFSI